MRDNAATNRYAEASQKRITAARVIADSLRHEPSLHQLAMKAVFVLEDCHEALTRCKFADNDTQGACAPPKASKQP